jgi:glycosyltransferase involved in cell wall biosynthesis
MVKDGETGMIFQKGDVSSLAAVLEQLLTDSALRGALGKSARHHVESERTWKNTAAIAADIIRRLTPKEKTNK